jgi:tetratricopeptide (TPR) repeat protein
MKIWLSSAGADFVLACAGVLAGAVFLPCASVAASASGPALASARLPQAGKQGSTTSSASAAQQTQTQGDSLSADQRAEIYYDFTLAHLYEQEYINTNSSDDADRALDLYKKAYALDPSSHVIGEQLAEMYYLSQRIADAVKEAQDILRRDPGNLPVRRLLSRIYIRTLGDLHDSSEQQNAIKQAITQLTEVVRLDPSDDDSAIWLARLYRANNQHDQAEQILRAILARDPENEGAVDQLTQLLLDENKFDETIALLEKALKETPSASLYERLGEAYTSMHDPSHAEDAYRHAIGLDPDATDPLRGLAQSLFEQGKYAEAAQSYQRLVGLEPNEVNNYLRLADTFREMHQLDKAEQEVLLARQHAPGNLEVIYNEATIYEAEARYDDAVQVLSNAIAGVKGQSEFTPTRRRTLAILYQQLGQVYRDQENYSAAIGTFQEMAQLGPEEDQRTRSLIIEVYRSDRDLTHAFETARKGLTDYPEDRNLKISEAMLYGDNNQPDQAALILRPLLDNSPADLEIEIDLGTVYAQDQRYSDAEQAARSAEKFVQETSDRETIGYLLGDIYARQKKYDQAEKMFQGVLAIDPQNAAVLNYYGYVLADRGVRLDEALTMGQRALAADPNNAAYLDSIGWTYYKQGKLAEAEASIRKAVAHDSHDPTMLSHLGDVLDKSGHADQAEAAWEKALAEWHRTVPAEFEADKVSDLEQKISTLKHRMEQQKTSSDSGQQ